MRTADELIQRTESVKHDDDAVRAVAMSMGDQKAYAAGRAVTALPYGSKARARATKQHKRTNYVAQEYDRMTKKDEGRTADELISAKLHEAAPRHFGLTGQSFPTPKSGDDADGIVRAHGSDNSPEFRLEGGIGGYSPGCQHCRGQKRHTHEAHFQAVKDDERMLRGHYARDLRR